ncbi:MAG: polysaccharide pyruvyl transferase family protein [Flavobacteriaceae bacterium]|nr:polysaccharide pyruvyl transferase family protein [Flavobacteriaceae bacterium]
MKILIIGQCTLHWGRMEFGNIGNYYIIEPFVRELYRIFPEAEISTTFQMSERFCLNEKVTVLPMEYYYGFHENDLTIAENEYKIAKHYAETKQLRETTPYIEAVLESDLVIDFSGDIWGDNADFLGENRFLVGLYKDRVAQLLGKKTVMLAGSPGPFSEEKNLDFAKEVFENFDLVTNREAISRGVLHNYGFHLSKLVDLSCPAFLFEPKQSLNIATIHPDFQNKSNIVGLIVCGWNFLKGPFDLWPRDDEDYDFIIKPITTFLEQNPEVTLCLMSHSNGFIPGKTPFELIHGRDYPIMKQIQNILENKGFAERFFMLDGVYDAWTTKAIISHFDMLVSGRVHAAVSGFSQFVPTVVIDYGHEPKAHKLKGFANEAGMIDYVADPEKPSDILQKLQSCWQNKVAVRQELTNIIPQVKQKARENFNLLKKLFT